MEFEIKIREFIMRYWEIKYILKILLILERFLINTINYKRLIISNQIEISFEKHDNLILRLFNHWNNEILS